MSYKTLSSLYPLLDIPENLFNAVSNMDTAYKETSTNYPPFNIIQIGTDVYKVEIGVSGFKSDELELIKEGYLLSVKGNPQKKEEEFKDEEVKYLRRKLSKRSFKLDFTLGRDIFVEGVSLEDGILSIELKKIIPEEMKPKRLEILDKSNIQQRLN